MWNMYFELSLATEKCFGIQNLFIDAKIYIAVLVNSSWNLEEDECISEW